ncbi:hypothetical protein H0W26_00535 [Candidatus Dependentiae bacterium]|nr:hypothetical protein [Candidatus Dependentiae bacterium]
MITISRIQCILLLVIPIVSLYGVFIMITTPYTTGLTTLSFVDNTRIFDNQPRTLHVFVWYPVKTGTATQTIDYDIWKIKNAAKEASPLLGKKKLPLILFSHGYSGHPYANSWFAEYLASKGYIVASVQHYGNSFPESMIPEISARPWNRPKDMSFVLDKLLEHPLFKDCIDKDRIGAAGFSQGGIAALWLAGMKAHLTKDMLKEQITFINDPFLRNKHFKELTTKRLDADLPNFSQEDFDQANQSYKDSRIKAVFALAPGIDEKNPMFLKEGLSLVNIPVCIVVGEGDDVATAQFFAQHIPDTSNYFGTLTVIPGKVTHWTLLNEPTEQGKTINPFITTDDPSIDRAQVHRDIGSMALQFFDEFFYYGWNKKDLSQKNSGKNR